MRNQKVVKFIVITLLLMTYGFISTPNDSEKQSCHAEFLQIARTQQGLSPKELHDVLESGGASVENPGQTIRLIRDGGIEIYDINRGDYFSCLDADAK
jgi:hypothetical protein